MFDEVEINGKIFKMFFDKDKFKLHIESNYNCEVEDYYKDKNIVEISNYILFIDTRGKYNNSSIEYNVEGYIKCNMKKFKPQNFHFIIFKSNKIAQLLYSTQKLKKYVYNIKKDKTDFDVSFICSNKLNISEYYEITNESCIKLKINACEDWREVYKIIKSILNSLATISLDKDIDNCNIFLYEKINAFNIGEIKFCEHNNNNEIINYLGNVHKVQDVMRNIIETIYCTPNISLSFIPSYFRKCNSLDFFRIYSSFEYEYKFIKTGMYNDEMKSKLEESIKVKKEALNKLKMLGTNLPHHFEKYINNYNPMEGHKEKLKNAYIFCNNFMNSRLDYMRISEIKDDFIKYIYDTRIKITHNPSDNIIITNVHYTNVFNEIIYGLFLKRCNIDDLRIKAICDDILIPVI